jgi:hypothetical protein
LVAKLSLKFHEEPALILSGMRAACFNRIQSRLTTTTITAKKTPAISGSQNALLTAVIRLSVRVMASGCGVAAADGALVAGGAAVIVPGVVADVTVCGVVAVRVAVAAWQGVAAGIVSGGGTRTSVAPVRDDGSKPGPVKLIGIVVTRSAPSVTSLTVPTLVHSGSKMSWRPTAVTGPGLSTWTVVRHVLSDSNVRTGLVATNVGWAGVGGLELVVAVDVPDDDVGVAVDETGDADVEPFVGFVAAAAVAAPTATATTTATTAHRLTDDPPVSH